MAQRLREHYWLYVVEDALDRPHLTPIPDPAVKLPPPEEVVGVVKVVFQGWQEALKAEAQ
jgi:hypothetical protein